MTVDEREYVVDTIENEGFHYAFHDYTDFRDNTDAEFHRLRKEYLEATKKLADYIGVRV